MDTAAFKDFQKWAQSPDTKVKEATARTNAWIAFAGRFPNADKNQFVAQVNIDEKRNITAEIFFKEVPGSLQSVFGSDRRYRSQKRKYVLGLTEVEGFPYQLSPMKNKKSAGHPSCKFCRNTCKPGKNVQPTPKHLRDPRHLLHDKIQRNLSTNQAQAQKCI